MARIDPPHVVVVGAGNAALTAALSAAAEGARVTVLEAAPRQERGGNSWFTAGLVRIPHEGVPDVLTLVDAPTPPTPLDIPPYPERAFRHDLERASDGRVLPHLADTLVRDARPTMSWLRSIGVRFQLASARGRQSFEIDGTLRFWGGACVEFEGGGVGHMGRLFRLLEDTSAVVRYGATAVELLRDGDRVAGVTISDGETVEADAVVLACGGFEADPDWRSRHLGTGWRDVQVRGTAHNRGAGLRMALAAGAEPVGDWSGCHAVAWDAGAPPTGDWEIRNAYQKHSYPFGLVVNAEGRRFLDEGADFRNHTYARYGAALLEQPGRSAVQVFDSRAEPLLRREYAIPEATRVQADTLEGLAARLGIPVDVFLDTVTTFNAAVNDRPFDPTRLDGKAARGISPPKSNWAMPLEVPPFLGFPVRCGITFTYGGIAIDAAGRVCAVGGRPIPGLHAAGEMVGGLFWGNYPGGSGLTSGSVFGRIAGRTAARRV